MLIRSMIRHKIHDDAHAMLLAIRHHAVEIGQRSVHRIDVFIISDVIAKIDLRRRIAGRNPDRVYSEVMQVLHLGSDAIQIADAIVIAVGKTARIDFIEDSMLPPLVAFGVDRLGLRTRRQSTETNQKEQRNLQKSSKHERPFMVSRKESVATK